MNKLILFKPEKAFVSKWSAISWRKTRDRVLKLQRIIYNASLGGNIRKVRKS